MAAIVLYNKSKQTKDLHEQLMVQAAVQETQWLSLIVGTDGMWLKKLEAELRAMHPLSLQYWLQNIKKRNIGIRAHNAKR